VTIVNIRNGFGVGGIHAQRKTFWALFNINKSQLRVFLMKILMDLKGTNAEFMVEEYFP
jgi:hypothetical protein